MNPRAVQYERPDADQVQITSRSDEAAPSDNEQVISVSGYMNQQQQREPKQCSAECQTNPIPLPNIQLNDYSPDENEQKFAPHHMNYSSSVNAYPNNSMQQMQQQNMNEFVSPPNPMVGFSDEVSQSCFVVQRSTPKFAIRLFLCDNQLNVA